MSANKGTGEKGTGSFLGIPYDWRRPTAARTRSRWWNAEDPRVFTPKVFGWGYDLNLYRILHPLKRTT